MKKFNLLSLFFLLVSMQRASSFSWLKDYKASNAYVKKDYNRVREILEKEQIDNPNDAHLNYNLGTVYYKLNQLEKAKFSFDRAVNNCSSKKNQLKEISLFNLGNSLYKNCLQILPPDWEKNDLEQQLLDAAIKEVQGAVERYKNVLTLNKDNNKAKVNLKKAEELLKKLQDKKQKQQQQNEHQDKQKDQQQDKQKQDQQQQQNKDQQSQQDKQQSQQDKSQKNQDQQGQGKQDQKESAEKDDKNQKDQQQNKEGEKNSQQGEDKRNDRTNDKLKDQETRNKEEGISQESTHEKDSQKKEQQTAQPEENGTEEGQDKQEGATFAQNGQEENQKEKGLRGILDALQSDESKMQKAFIMQKSKGQDKRLDSKQKPW
jgi:hypothetical protein